MPPATETPAATLLPPLGPELRRRVEALPRLTALVGDFLALAQKETLTAPAFESALAAEPVLSRWLLRQANSSYFLQARPIASLGEAAVVIGVEKLKRMVYAVVTRDLLDHRLRVYRYAGQGLWLHAMAVGTLARGIAAAAAARGGRPPLEPEAALVAGLVHDVGKRVIDRVLPVRGGPRAVSRAEERAAAGMDHAEVSAHAAAVWNLPEPVVRAVARHHATPTPGLLDGAGLIALADAVALAWGAGPTPYVRPREAAALSRWQDLRREGLGLDDDTWERILADLGRTVAGLAEMLRLCTTNPVVDPPAGSSRGGSPASGPEVRESRRSAPSAAEDPRSGPRRGRTDRGRGSRRGRPHRALGRRRRR
jgi:putative nucleotidyltransferase with HDIG domain